MVCKMERANVSGVLVRFVELEILNTENPYTDAVD